MNEDHRFYSYYYYYTRCRFLGTYFRSLEFERISALDLIDPIGYAAVVHGVRFERDLKRIGRPLGMRACDSFEAPTPRPPSNVLFPPTHYGFWLELLRHNDF